MKKVLIVSGCYMRGDTTGLVGKFLNTIKDIDKKFLNISLFDIGFFDVKHNPSNYPVDCYYGLPVNRIESIIRKLPRFRSWYAEYLIVSTFKKLLKKNYYNAVILHHIPTFADRLVSISHQYKTQIIFYPGGSDILRVDERLKKRLMYAFSKVDYVVGAVDSNVILKSKEIYHVPDSKIKLRKTYLSGVRMLMSVDAKISKNEMMKIVGIPNANYNIVCSYNGYKEHRHSIIIDSVIKNKGNLPRDYQLVFPMTYGAPQGYIDELRKKCSEAGLNAVFLTSFITNEQMAYLHLVTDLFIEIQPTDSGNAFMIEALFAGNRIITGSWLNYRQFEQFGIPYHLIDSIEELPEMLCCIFSKCIARPVISNELINYYKIPKDYSSSSFWEDLFSII